MATKLFLRNTTLSGITNTGDGVCYDLHTVAGSAVDTDTVDTVASGTNVQYTQSAAGPTIAWISRRVPSGGFTLTSVDVSAWLAESATQANARGRFRIYRYQPTGPVITELGGSPFDDDKVELSTTITEDTWTANVTDQAFSENDRILIRFFITNASATTMASGRTCTIQFNAADAATGDSFINLAETVAFKANETNKVVNVTQARTRTITRHVFERNLISVAQGVSVVQMRGAPKAIAVTMPQNASGFGRGMIAVAAQTGDGLLQAVTAFATMGAGGATTQKAISAAQAQAVTLGRGIRKLVAALQASAVLAFKRTGHNVVPAVTVGQNVSGVAQAIIGLAAQTGTGPAQTVTATAVRFAAPVPKLISAVQAQTVRLGRGIRKLVTVLQASAVTVFRKAGHRITVAQTQLVTAAAAKAAGGLTQKLLSLTQSHAFTLIAEVHTRATIGLVTMGQNVTAFAAKAGGAPTEKIINATTAQNVFGFARAMIAVAAQTGTGLLQAVTAFAAKAAGTTTQKLISVLQAQAVTAFATKAAGASTNKLLTVLQAQTVTLGRRIGHLISVASAQSLVVFRNITGISGKLITVSQAQSITLFRSLAHRVTVATTQAVTVLRAMVHRISVTMAQVVTRVAIRARPKALSITQAQAVTVRRQLGKLIAVLTAQTITVLRRIVAKIVRISTAQSVVLVIDSVAQVRLKVITLVTTQTVIVLRNFARLFVIAQAQAVSVFGAFARRIRRGSISRGAPGDARDNTPDDTRHNTSIGIRKNTDPWHSG